MPDLEELIIYCQSNNRVCPLPQKWNDLYNLLPNTRRKDGGSIPSAPLILAAWHYASNRQKMLRLKEHIEWADQHRDLKKISKFIYSLNEEDWYHEND
jgi:hypothetical protein